MMKGSLTSIGLAIFTIGLSMFILASSLVLTYRSSAESSISDYRLYTMRVISNAENIKLLLDQERTYILDKAITFVGLNGGYMLDKMEEIEVDCNKIDNNAQCSSTSTCKWESINGNEVCQGTTTCKEILQAGAEDEYDECVRYEEYDIRWYPQKKIVNIEDIANDEVFLENVKTFVNNRLKYFDKRFSRLLNMYYDINISLKYHLDDLKYTDNGLITTWSSSNTNFNITGKNPLGDEIVQYNFTSLANDHYSFPLKKILDSLNGFDNNFDNLLKKKLSLASGLTIKLDEFTSVSYDPNADVSSCNGDKLCEWEVKHPED